MSATAESTEYVVRGGAREVFDSTDREVLIEGPARTGKSRSLLEKAYAVARKYPRSRILLVRKTRASMSESVLQTLEDHVFPPNQPWMGDAKRTHRDLYTLPNKSVIVPGGMDHTDKIMSTEWDRIFAFEWTEASEHDHERLLTRLSNQATRYNQIICDCNPAQPAHWLNQRANTTKMRRIYSRHQDNPRLHDGTDWTKFGREYMATLDALSGVRRARLRDGRWAQAEGVVYPEFDPVTHVLHEMPQGWQGWRKIRAIDFGFNDPFVCLWLADSGEALYVYRQLYMSGRIVEDHARQIVELSRGEEYVATVADHDREDRETLARHGVRSTPAEKAIERGIDAVRARLRAGANGKPRLYVLQSSLVEYDTKLADLKRPVGLLDEVEAYVWAQRTGGAAKDVPVDRDNHAMDALRYAVMQADRKITGLIAGVL
jgi:PBSX family phage terminase large subunit